MPKIVDKKEKAARIAAAAVPVFRRLGYARARMADIAGAAGVGKGTLYEYFRSKEAIFRSEFDRYFAAFDEGAARAMAEAGTPAERLLALVRFAFDHVSEWEDHCAVYVDYLGASRADDAAAFSLARYYERFEEVLAELVRAGQAAGEIDAELDPSAMAELLVSVFDGVVLHGVLAGRRSSGGALRATVLKVVERALCVDAPRRARERGGEC